MDQGELNESRDTSHSVAAESRKAEGRGAPEMSSQSLLTRKASSSLKRRETEVIKGWLRQVIDSLGLPSLQAFPTRELAEGFPAVIDGVAEAIADPKTIHSRRREVVEVSGLLARLHKEDPSIERFVEDYSLLKGCGCRSSAIRHGGFEYHPKSRSRIQ
jgi:hypothetical protein